MLTSCSMPHGVTRGQLVILHNVCLFQINAEYPSIHPTLSSSQPSRKTALWILGHSEDWGENLDLCLTAVSTVYIIKYSMAHCNIKTVFSGIGIPLRPSNAIWRQKSGWTLAQVMACCLMAPSHYLNQCWFMVGKVEWHSSKGKFTRDNSAINHWNYLEN